MLFALSEVGIVEWDLGIQGLGVLAIMAVAFAIITQAIFWGTGWRWAWLIGFVVFFVGGLFTSEVWFGWATAADLQPNIDGLSFDEVLLICYGVGIPAALIARFLLGRQRHQISGAH